MENKFNVEKSDCMQENFEFFTGSVGNEENNDAEYNKGASENGNVENLHVFIDE